MQIIIVIKTEYPSLEYFEVLDIFDMKYLYKIHISEKYKISPKPCGQMKILCVPVRGADIVKRSMADDKGMFLSDRT